MITLAAAEKCIEDLKSYDLKKGRDEKTWFMYHNHVYGVAHVAQKLASKLSNINPQRAYVLGLLHDIGRIPEQYEKRFHGIWGYEYLKDIDKEAARISLTHMFTLNKIDEYENIKTAFFDKKEDYDFIKEFLQNNPINEIDKLIQLSDALANAYGFVTIEERNAEYIKRHGCSVPESVLKNMFVLKKYFDDVLGEDVYNILNEISTDWMLSPK